jgi:hypothetical protein
MRKDWFRWGMGIKKRALMRNASKESHVIGNTTSSKGNCFWVSQGGFKADTSRKYGEHVILLSGLNDFLINSFAFASSTICSSAVL